ncbi:NAD+ synthase [Candidatus Pseudothioglobus singularis]|uniref:Glutamine-dependent NAD(+) synthetase n=1 Tax=Candidatus Pseudothioglobus singularis PS1 TaxID=1125411 RepID=A0A0M4LGP4_9GAMM|nr:NAD+ synthase [Candidatus Pseudothioglobus singularis]ALE01877.1 NAD+ synthetase [Candidatus Pseudothioglobus singularis PS1]
MIIKTTEYLAMVRDKTGYSDYKIAKEYDINQSNLSKYSSGKAALSETHAWLIANILDIDPAEVVANTKFEHAINTGNNSKAKFWQEQLNKIFSETSPIRIQIAQFNPIVGDIKLNAQKMLDLSIEANNAGAHLIIFPELALTGYPPEDLLFRDGFTNQVKEEITNFCNLVPSDISILFGAPNKTDDFLFNSAYLIQNNRIFNIYNKQELPNYGVFDEKRYFSSGVDSFVFECQNTKIGVLICEDQWVEGPISSLCQSNIDIVVSLNASPFQLNKQSERINICKNYALKFDITFIYVNMVGGQDEVVFDGNSFIVNNQGDVSLQLPAFKELSVSHIDTTFTPSLVSNVSLIYSAIVLATKDYIQKNTFGGALIGLSGGIDSALTLAIAVDAIGAENVHAVMMPYQFTSDMSLTDSELQAETQGVEFSSIDIHSMVDSFNLSLSDQFRNTSRDTTEENIQSRVRGTLLMALSNKSHKLVLATGNKSEMAVGYATLYGDMCGGFAPLKDISKTMVYQLAKYRNTLSDVIPERVITRPPSAELAPDQVDQDSLPSYDILDDILMRFVEQKQSVNEIIENGHNSEDVNKITSLILRNEYKRRQSAPGPKISSNAFGKERRYPMTSKFKP